MNRDMMTEWEWRDAKRKAQGARRKAQDGGGRRTDKRTRGDTGTGQQASVASVNFVVLGVFMSLSGHEPHSGGMAVVLL